MCGEGVRGSCFLLLVFNLREMERQKFYRSEKGRRIVYNDLLMVEMIGDQMASRAIELGERTMERKSILSRCASV